MTVELTESSTTAIDPEQWPSVASVPHGVLSALSARIASHLLQRSATILPLRLVYPNGKTVGADDPDVPTLFVHQPNSLAHRVGRSGLIGFGESYMAGEWDADDLVGVLTALATGVADRCPRALQRLRPITMPRQPRSHRNSREGARRNISEHYDLSNGLFMQFLDETMTYSSALFDDFPANWDQFADAQRRKIDRLLDAAQVGPGSRVLEIGTGWGELAIRSASRGAYVRSLTLSVEQQRLAQERVAKAGLSARVCIDLCDYRDVHGCYDAVVSVEMIEAVGYSFWPTYFRILDSLVAPTARVAIQAITMPHSRMLASRNTHTWIQKYIFPGGMLPSTQAILGITERHTRLRAVDVASLRPHYAETLRLWRERFLQRCGAVSALGFHRVFQRMWVLYLAYSEAGFRSGYLDVHQWTFSPTGGRW